MNRTICLILGLSMGVALGWAVAMVRVRIKLLARRKRLDRFTDPYNINRWEEAHDCIHDLFPKKVRHDSDDLDAGEIWLRAVVGGIGLFLVLLLCYCKF